MEKLKENFIKIGIWGLVCFFTVLYISLLFNHNIWTDEAFTLQLLRGNVKEIIAGTAADVHPPLYYLYAKLFDVICGSSLIVQKIAAIIPMVATLVFIATVIRKHFGDMTSFLSLLFLSCIPCSMEFALQVRMYSLALFFVTVCAMYAYLAFLNGNKKEFLIFALSGVAAAYTHYFAFVSIIIITGMLLLAILIWRRERVVLWLISAVS
ncbi:MAG: glycosyltransferase family 39 protein, partial [Lachnospiraceae bacterium]|nr:glycosyltransferase family 39 protein [Lachnospiraceae bacterium]